MRSLIRSLVKFFPKDLALPRTGRDISGERKVMYFLLFSPNSAFFISYPLASINVRKSVVSATDFSGWRVFDKKASE